MRWLAALAFVPGVGLADSYMRCHLSNEEPGAKTCFLPLVNATYNCTVSAGVATCEDQQLRPIECRVDPVGLFCIPGARAHEPAAHVTISGFLPFPEPKPKLVVAPRRSMARATTPEPRNIPTIHELMNPPRPSPAEEALMDAADAAAEAAESAAKAAAGTGAAIRDLGIQQREAREQAQQRAQRGISCRWLGNTLFCDP